MTILNDPPDTLGAELAQHRRAIVATLQHDMRETRENDPTRALTHDQRIELIKAHALILHASSIYELGRAIAAQADAGPRVIYRSDVGSDLSNIGGNS